MKKTKAKKGITLIALMVTVIVLLILAVVTINGIAGDNGIIAKAKEARILAIIASIKDEIGVDKVKSAIEDRTLTIEKLFADGKIRRKVEAETIDAGEEQEDTYYIYYAIKDGAFEGMNGLGKGVQTDVFLIDDEFHISYIDEKGKEYGDSISKKILEDDTQIRFASPAFEAYVSKLGGETEDKMLFKWMKTQTSLTISDTTIDSLEDLVFFPNLTSLTLIVSIDKVQSLNGIECCQKLTYLSIEGKGNAENGDKIDFTALKSLSKLSSMVVFHAFITDRTWDNLIDSLKDIETLTSFRCGGSGEGCGITSMKGVGKLKHLTSLSITATTLGKIEDLNNLVDLTNLYFVGYGQTIDADGVSVLKNATNLELSATNLANVNALKNLTNLTTLTLNNNKITDITSIDNLTNLGALSLSGNQIIDITPIGKLTNLKTLNLANNQITDILPLAGCTSLTSLNLKGNTEINGDKSAYDGEGQAKLLKIGEIMTQRNGTITVDKEQLGLFNGYTNLDLSWQSLTDLACLKRTNRVSHFKFKP